MGDSDGKTTERKNLKNFLDTLMFIFLKMNNSVRETPR